MTDTDKKSILDILVGLGELQEQARIEFDEDCDQWWGSLSRADQLKAFYSVTKRIYQGDVVDNGSYRHVLYDKFGFEPDAYGVGMDSGYMTLHNLIAAGRELERVRTVYAAKVTYNNETVFALPAGKKHKVLFYPDPNNRSHLVVDINEAGLSQKSAEITVDKQ
jgi:hypothetical protein